MRKISLVRAQQNTSCPRLYDVWNSSPVDNFETTAGIRSEEERKPERATVFWVAEPVPVPWVSRWAHEGARPSRCGGRKRTSCHFLLRPRSSETCAVGPPLSRLVPVVGQGKTNKFCSLDNASIRVDTRNQLVKHVNNHVYFLLFSIIQFQRLKIISTKFDKIYWSIFNFE